MRLRILLKGVQLNHLATCLIMHFLYMVYIYYAWYLWHEWLLYTCTYGVKFWQGKLKYWWMDICKIWLNIENSYRVVEWKNFMRKIWWENTDESLKFTKFVNNVPCLNFGAYVCIYSSIYRINSIYTLIEQTFVPAVSTCSSSWGKQHMLPVHGWSLTHWTLEHVHSSYELPLLI